MRYAANYKADSEPLQAFIEQFIEYQVKYEKAVECVSKDRDTLLTFYDFLAEHWKHLGTTNPAVGK